jgi:hypothetical protein
MSALGQKQTFGSAIRSPRQQSDAPSSVNRAFAVGSASIALIAPLSLPIIFLDREWLGQIVVAAGTAIRAPGHRRPQARGEKAAIAAFALIE